MAINRYISIINLSINAPSAPIKRQTKHYNQKKQDKKKGIGSEWIKNKTHMLPIRLPKRPSFWT